MRQSVLLKDEPLARYTSWRVGGAAKKLYKPSNVVDLARFLQELPATEPILWLGLGSNTLIRDSGFSGTVIVLQGCLADITVLKEQAVRVDAGVSCAKMARFCARHALQGAEFWAGIPGTMGGALRMNAGCFGHETWDKLITVETINRSGKVQQRLPKDFQVSYRRVTGPGDEWFVAATFQLAKGSAEESQALIRDFLAKRAKTQPINEHNSGSVFRNPEGDYAARLIESCGLKGYAIGGASVSQKHANFIVNRGDAMACDIEQLIHYVQQQVFEKENVLLQPEVHVFGEELNEQ